ncbi:MAG: hypothetical protein M5U14_13085 [Acidimicrobiia bacterium]|nr:hypothetical protein [Acidimicrobiia bacterium]
MSRNVRIVLIVGAAAAALVATACSGDGGDDGDGGDGRGAGGRDVAAGPTLVDREASIPAGAEKATPETDEHPPVLHSDEWEQPAPVPGISTAGAEDAPFVTADGAELWFFFTPDLSVPPEEQLLDGATGIYVATRAPDGRWGEPQRVVLSEGPSLEGCPTVRGGELWFCTVREGYATPTWFRARPVDGEWDWEPIGDELDGLGPDASLVGELHVTGGELVFDSSRPGGAGGRDLWVAERDGEGWAEPTAVTAVNSAADESRPFVTADGSELWFTRDVGVGPEVWRSRRVGRDWGTPELVVSSLAGEPTVDPEGNLYFVHHHLQGDTLVEADIYVATRR